jgi:hypothetical protein
MTAIRRLGVWVLCSALAALVGCEAAKQSSLQSSRPEFPTMTQVGQMWRDVTSLEVRVRGDREPRHWIYNLSTAGINYVAQGRGGGGEMMLIEGKLLLARGMVFTAGNELDIFDDAMLTQQLVFNLLEVAFPQGPASIQDTLVIAVDERDREIRTETTNTTRVYFTPWNARAQVTRTNPDSLDYFITFDAPPSGPGGRRTRLELEGKWSNMPGTAGLPDDYRLDTWQAYRLRLGTRPSGGITMAVWVATPDSRRYRTLGEARASVGRVR